LPSFGLLPQAKSVVTITFGATVMRASGARSSITSFSRSVDVIVRVARPSIRLSLSADLWILDPRKPPHEPPLGGLDHVRDITAWPVISTMPLIALSAVLLFPSDPARTAVDDRIPTSLQLPALREYPQSHF
jgi:hypothetical protein